MLTGLITNGEGQCFLPNREGFGFSSICSWGLCIPLLLLTLQQQVQLLTFLAMTQFVPCIKPITLSTPSVCTTGYRQSRVLFFLSDLAALGPTFNIFSYDSSYHKFKAASLHVTPKSRALLLTCLAISLFGLRIEPISSPQGRVDALQSRVQKVINSMYCH